MFNDGLYDKVNLVKLIDEKLEENKKSESQRVKNLFYIKIIYHLFISFRKQKLNSIKIQKRLLIMT